MRALLLGDEAVAQAAIDAGIAGAFSYPGTPATEIFEFIEATAGREGTVSAVWSANEKVAYEEALGMSYTGKRSVVSMKHVGLNVAADPFINSALTGINGGLVLAVADDPGMHSSQNEQDSRFYADFAQIPVFEPSNQQEAYELTLEAFDYSEAVGLPVMIRLVTRLAHSRANVTTRDPAEVAAAAEARQIRPASQSSAWTLVPSIARERFKHLKSLQPRLVDDAERSPHNPLKLGGPRGLIASGLANNYVQEVLAGDSEISLLKITHYPLPVARLRELVNHCDEILVAEEGYPLIEQRLTGVLGIPGKAIKGKLSGDLPLTGELTPDALAEALGRPLPPGRPAVEHLANRPPQLCKGCPHIDSFKALVEATADHERPLLFSDIGCYTLGVMPPYRAVHSTVDMGASIAMAHGATRAGAHPVLCTIGDSTFAHSGITGLLSAVQDDANMTVLILDNSTVAMTGAQETMTSGERLKQVLLGLGVDPEHLHVINPHPKHHKENVELLRGEIAHPGLSVVVPTRPCIHIKKTRLAKAAAKQAPGQ